MTPHVREPQQWPVGLTGPPPRGRSASTDTRAAGSTACIALPFSKTTLPHGRPCTCPPQCPLHARAQRPAAHLSSRVAMTRSCRRRMRMSCRRMRCPVASMLCASMRTIRKNDSKIICMPACAHWEGQSADLQHGVAGLCSLPCHCTPAAPPMLNQCHKGQQLQLNPRC